VSINPPESATVQPLGFDKMEDLIVFRDRGLWKLVQEIEDLLPVPEVTARQFPDHEWMAEHFPVVEERSQAGVAPAQVLDPHGGINEDHAALAERRRRMGRIPFSVPPRSARRRALSRAMRASRPRRIREVFSLTPVRREARWRRESSTFSVVLICIKMA
jgi:hypothetical protein